MAGELPSNGQHGATAERQEKFSKGAYFLGKGVWGKGYTELLDLLAKVCDPPNLAQSPPLHATQCCSTWMTTYARRCCLLRL